MRPVEAKILAKWALELGLPPGTICLNVGSSDRDFRQSMQPHVEELFIRPLEAAGIRFVHCDMQAADGVDEVGDVLDPEFQARLKSYNAKLLVCSNVLEHLARPRAFARACGDLVRDGGYGLFSVPSSYPYHPDPIDTMLRLSPDQLAAFLTGWEVVKAREIDGGSYWDDLRKAGNPLLKVAHQAARVALPVYRPRHWRANASRLSWLFRRYRTSLLLAKKASKAPRAQD